MTDSPLQQAAAEKLDAAYVLLARNEWVQQNVYGMDVTAAPAREMLSVVLAALTAQGDVILTRGRCPGCDENGLVERMATPAEVDNGCELGIAYDPCPSCSGTGYGPVEVRKVEGSK